ncbi:AIPR family protein [Noviherbaspirillum sp. 1P10PC]|uniref:AIPR family protein n=1 Tax=Noviherbaspirillum sp. 1P10PC TaxID=3132292 RepID=UPI0039A12D06
MDRITASLVDEFSEEYGIEKYPADKKFEALTAHLLIGRVLGDNVDFEDLICAGGNDLGIDAIAIIVNGQVVVHPDEVDEIAHKNGYLEVKFVFVQAETSSNFDGQKLGNFADGIKEFFSQNPTLPRNTTVEGLAKVMSAVYAKSGKFTRGNPEVYAFYATTGMWTADAHLEAKRAAKENEIAETEGGLFKLVELRCIDRSRIQTSYNSLKNAVSREFVFERKAVVPDIPGVSEAYVGVLPAPEFIRIVEDEYGQIIKSIFYDNVRDWQDFNEVNNEIRGTLSNAQHQLRFALMNNGVTIIAKELRSTGNKFFIQDYQVVNGCQTSHVLQQNKDLLSDKVMVPLRLIASTDEEVISGIIKATNRQTEVSEEQLLAVSDFQKDLERFFLSYADKKRLYYERRSRQYNSRADIEKVRIVSPTNLIRAFSSMYLGVPHRTLRSYKSLLSTVGKDLFVAGHKLELYYACAFAFYKLEYFFRSGLIDSKYKVARFQILLAFKLRIIGAANPPLNSGKAEAKAKEMEEILWDDEKAAKAFLNAVNMVEEIQEAGHLDRDSVHTEQFTEKLLKHPATK